MKGVKLFEDFIKNRYKQKSQHQNIGKLTNFNIKLLTTTSNLKRKGEGRNCFGTFWTKLVLFFLQYDPRKYDPPVCLRDKNFNLLLVLDGFLKNMV